MTHLRTDEHADPRLLTVACLQCAIEACRGSVYLVDRNFSLACAAELRARRDVVLKRKARPSIEEAARNAQGEHA
jgi:hypothetical protein